MDVASPDKQTEHPRQQPRRFLWLYMPDLSMLGRVPVQVALLANFLSGLAIGTLSYGAMVHLARSGGSQFEVALVSAASFLPGLVLGTQGGLIADSLPKRLALAVTYLMQAGLCIGVPILLGADFIVLLFIVLVVSTLAQISIPAVRSIIPLVAKPQELAVAAVLMSLTTSTGSAIGQAFFAPVLLRVGDITLVTIFGGVMLLLAGLRVFGLPDEEGIKVGDALRSVDWRLQGIGVRPTAEWIVEHRVVATMVLLGAMVSALYEAFAAMMPGFVGTVLGVDPVDTILVFATIPIGFLAATFAGPWLMNKFGERPVMLVSVVIFGGGIILFGLIEEVAPFLAPFSPLHLLELFGIQPSEKVLAAGLLTIPAYAGFTAAGAAAQTYINRRLPVTKQAGAFGIENTLRSALAIVAVLTFGALATLFGTRPVFLIAPFVMGVLLIGIIIISYRFSEADVPRGLEVLTSFWEEEESQIRHRP